MTTYLVVKRMQEDRDYLPGEVLKDPDIPVGILMQRGYLQIVPDNFRSKPASDTGTYTPTGPERFAKPEQPIDANPSGPEDSESGNPVSDSEPQVPATTGPEASGEIKLPPVIDLSGVQATEPTPDKPPETKPPETKPPEA